jgi:hypothetical protein
MSEKLNFFEKLIPTSQLSRPPCSSPEQMKVE